MTLGELPRPCLCWGPGMIPKPQLHIAAAGGADRAIALLEWSPANGQWLDRIELSSADVYEAFDYETDTLPSGCVLPQAHEHLAMKP